MTTHTPTSQMLNSLAPDDSFRRLNPITGNPLANHEDDVRVGWGEEAFSDWLLDYVVDDADLWVGVGAADGWLSNVASRLHGFRPPSAAATPNANFWVGLMIPSA